ERGMISLAAEPRVSSTASTDVPLELAPAIDRASFAERFRSRGRVHIPNVLARRSAERLYKCLSQETQWSVTFNNGQDFLDVDNMSQDERTKLMFSVWPRAHNAFQYLFDNHRLSRSGEPSPDGTHYS